MTTASSPLAYVERPDEADRQGVVIRLGHPPVNALTNALSADLAASARRGGPDDERTVRVAETITGFRFSSDQTGPSGGASCRS